TGIVFRPTFLIFPFGAAYELCHTIRPGRRFFRFGGAFGFLGGTQSRNSFSRRLGRDELLCVVLARAQRDRRPEQAQQFSCPCNPHSCLRLRCKLLCFSTDTRILLCASWKGQCAEVLTKVT